AFSLDVSRLFRFPGEDGAPEQPRSKDHGRPALPSPGPDGGAAGAGPSGGSGAGPLSPEAPTLSSGPSALSAAPGRDHADLSALMPYLASSLFGTTLIAAP